MSAQAVIKIKLIVRKHTQLCVTWDMTVIKKEYEDPLGGIKQDLARG